MAVWVVYHCDYADSIFGAFDSAEKARDYIIEELSHYMYDSIEEDIEEVNESFKTSPTSFGVEDFIWAMMFIVQ